MREELTSHYVQLLKDNEAEVRTAAAGQIPGTLFGNLHWTRSLMLKVPQRFLKTAREGSHFGTDRTLRTRFVSGQLSACSRRPCNADQWSCTTAG